MSKVSVNWKWGGMVHGENGQYFKEEATNSAGGICVDVNTQITENSKKIKYIEFEMCAYNRVGDPIPSDTTESPLFTLQIIGPLSPNKNGIIKTRFYNHDDCVFYNKAIHSVSLVSVKITFMDGSVEEIAGKDTEWLKGGCYVATCIYGSYDCPQVWTLRRYRDYELAKTWHGRVFIHTYYAVSPILVKWFGEAKWFKAMWKPKLDKMVKELQASGVESSPYEDKMWR